MTPLPRAFDLPETATTACATACDKPSYVFPAALGALIVCVLFSLVACATPSTAQTPPTEVLAAAPTPVFVPEPAPAPEPEQIEANNIYFESGSVTIGAHDETKLRAHAERLKADPDSRVTLVGHTDDLGSRNYNLALSEQRMLAVSQWLRKYGVRSKQIQRYRGDSERVPNSCKSAECRQKMRRVELVFPQL